MATLLRTDGSIRPAAPANGRDFSLKELYALTSSDIVEHVALRDGRSMWVDEEGWLKRRPLNVGASILAGTEIAGDALVCDRDEVR